MAAGSMAVYTPILINLLKAKSDKGLSTQTWIMNILGISLACVYPFQKGFPLSTYVELVVLTVQSLIILGVICHYKHIEKEFLFSMIPFALYLFAVTRYSIPPTVLNFVQLASTLICNYANVPQILLGFREKRTGWSPITSGLSLAGNIIRVFTTLQLTKGDPLFLFGYILGAVFNSVLLWQTFIYRKK